MKRILYIIVCCIPFSVFGRETYRERYMRISNNLKQSITAETVETRTQLIQDIESKYSFILYVWNLISTYDITNKYHPYIQKYTLSCEVAAVKMVI